MQLREQQDLYNLAFITFTLGAVGMWHFIFMGIMFNFIQIYVGYTKDMGSVALYFYAGNKSIGLFLLRFILLFIYVYAYQWLLC